MLDSKIRRSLSQPLLFLLQIEAYSSDGDSAPSQVQHVSISLNPPTGMLAAQSGTKFIVQLHTFYMIP